MHKLKRFGLRVQPHHLATFERVVSVLVVAVLFAAQSSAADTIRLRQRSLMIYDSKPGVTTSYKVSFQYTTTAAVGSINMLFCIDPIPYHPCVAPTGIDVSQAVLAQQTGETGFNITTRSSNHLVLSRAAPAVVGETLSSYTFTGIVNPTYMERSFSIRLSDHESTDASGPYIDVGSVKSGITNDVTLETQVPPMLIFCMAQQVSLNCTDGEGYYTDMGTLSSKETLTAQSQMAVGTNASAGFVITANGMSMSAGTSEITPLKSPTPSAPGNNQFGMNLVANTTPAIGGDPDGDWENGVATADYAQPNKYKYQDGDVVASSPNVSLMRRFTVSYIVNSRPDLPAGVYTTTITYVASGRF